MKLLTLILISLSLAGCRSATTPSEALSSTAKAISDNSLSDLKDTIAWKAMDDYGSKEGLSKLRQKSGGDKITMGTVLTTSAPIYHEDRVWQYYAGSLYSGGRPYIDAEIVCASEDVSGDRSVSSSAVMVTFCFVSKMVLK